MTPMSCRRSRKDAGAFVDGELAGAERLALARHLAECADCEREVRAIRQVSDAIRAAAANGTCLSAAGLAAGVISRTGAESAQSWRTMFAHATEDWHWMMVGGGAVAARSPARSCSRAFWPSGPSRRAKIPSPRS